MFNTAITQIVATLESYRDLDLSFAKLKSDRTRDTVPHLFVYIRSYITFIQPIFTIPTFQSKKVTVLNSLCWTAVLGWTTKQNVEQYFYRNYLVFMSISGKSGMSLISFKLSLKYNTILKPYIWYLYFSSNMIFYTIINFYDT